MRTGLVDSRRMYQQEPPCPRPGPWKHAPIFIPTAELRKSSYSPAEQAAAKSSKPWGVIQPIDTKYLDEQHKTQGCLVMPSKKNPGNSNKSLEGAVHARILGIPAYEAC